MYYYLLIIFIVKLKGLIIARHKIYHRITIQTYRF